MKNSYLVKPKIMGILNVTPDSFSDGGDFNNLDSAVSQGKKMIDEGADIIDIGGESTRPGSKRISSQEQIDRVVHIIEAINETKPGHVEISIDTTQSEVAEAALSVGANIVNDVSGGNDDPEIIQLCAEKKCPELFESLCLTHFPVSVRAQGTLLAIGRAYGPRGSGGGSGFRKGATGLLLVKMHTFCMGRSKTHLFLLVLALGAYLGSLLDHSGFFGHPMGAYWPPLGSQL